MYPAIQSRRWPCSDESLKSLACSLHNEAHPFSSTMSPVTISSYTDLSSLLLFTYNHTSSLTSLLATTPPPPHFYISPRAMSTTPRLRSLNIDNINPNVRKAEYAVRGELAVKSEEYRSRINKGETKDLPFDSVISANIGNPQQLDQKPITFIRQVLSLVENPLLLEHEDVLIEKLGYKADVVERARWLLKEVGSVGAYSASAGAHGIRESVAKFIERMSP